MPLTSSRPARSLLVLNSLTSSDTSRPFPSFPRTLRISHTLRHLDHLQLLGRYTTITVLHCIHSPTGSGLQWELAVTNSTKSAFFLAKLRPKHGVEDGFFFRYKTTGSPVQQRRGVKCVLLVKVGLRCASVRSQAELPSLEDISRAEGRY